MQKMLYIILARRRTRPMLTMVTFYRKKAQSDDIKCLKHTVSIQLLSKKSEASIEFPQNLSL